MARAAEPKLLDALKNKPKIKFRSYSLSIEMN